MTTRESIAAIALACILALIPAAALFAFFYPAKRYAIM